MKNIEELSNEELQQLEEDIKLKEGLPHLFGWKRYKWQQEFMESRNRDNFLCAANQIGKSTIQICKAIDWATDTSIWGDLWHSRPTQFWYFYPSLKLATNEFNEKWVKEVLPRNGYENDSKYGWEPDMRQKTIHSIKFYSGITIYFCSYSQHETDLQAGTVYAMFCDEELDVSLWPELQARLRATRGYYHMVFTATRGEEKWRATIEERGKLEQFPNAFKRQISLYDCQKYVDGTPSQWTDERIREEMQRCGTQVEIDRRIFGKFVVEGGLMYPAFDRKKHYKEGHPINFTWNIYAAVDIGSGGDKGHPAAIVFIAVNPQYTKGRLIKCWRGDGVTTTASDIILKFIELRGKMKPVEQLYDWGSKDFVIVANRMGETFTPANKSRDFGIGIVNTLFKNDMLIIYRNYEDGDDEESRKVVIELSTLQVGKAKTNAKDDLADAVRYCCTAIPWDYSFIKGHKEEIKVDDILDDRDRFRHKQLTTNLSSNEIEEQDINNQMAMLGGEDFDEINELYGESFDS